MKMGKTMKFAIVMLFVVSLCACGNKEVETETESMETDIAVSDVTIQYEDNDTEQSSEDESEEVPFQVLIDKYSLEDGFKESDTVMIVTELTEWNYTVETDYGSITDKSRTSFVYKKPKGQYEDNIIISFVNKENAKVYKTVIPLYFMEPINEVTISFVPNAE